MSARLRLLDEVSWQGRPVTGERSHALLAALAAAGGRAVGEGDLAELVWGRDALPAQPGRALQVVVSRTRAQTGRDVVVRAERGYRLGLDPDDTDATALGRSVRAAEAAERTGDLVAARSLAREAVAHTVSRTGDEPDALVDLRARAREQRTVAAGVLGRAASATGDHAEALTHLAGIADPDEATLVARLRSEAAVRGAPAALERYEAHRERLRDRLGVDPGPVLQALHAELLAADHPVREGLLFGATSLVGRDDDLRALRAVVRESRVTSILGPGGLGKTRLAHLLGQGAEQPVVHFVELVGVSSPDDVVDEVGSALGVRDSVSGRRTLTPEQRRDVRARIAQQLDLAPTLLVLDNCEHVVTAVADLVAFLVATVPRLRVVTTTRAPLAIAAERVFALDQLDEDAAADLFTQRALAARPGALLDDGAVRRVVRRLDGLPLAIELAAAKVRAMSVDDIDRRLDDRFALLRGNDASAPDRHRTLMAVIDWSWNLLGAPERRALARLALFHDGFGLEAAESVTGADALAAVESLVGQSLLVVRESGAGLRYRMLETVREFGRQQLGDDAAPAQRALRDWAVTTCATALSSLYGEHQVETVQALAIEDTNLADALRGALAEPDPEAVAVVGAAMAGTWTIKGEHQRVIALAAAVDAALEGWTPPDHLVDAATRAATLVILNTAFAEQTQPKVSRALLTAHGERSTEPDVRAFSRLVTAVEDDDQLVSAESLVALGDHPDRHTALLALQWRSHHLENAGEVDEAVSVGNRALALWRPGDGAWTRALLQTQLVGLLAQQGRLAEAGRLALEALVTLDALDALDDATQLRSVLARSAILEGRLDDARRMLDEMDRRPVAASWGGGLVAATTRAELALAEGDVTRGLRLYDDAVEAVRALRFPGLDLAIGQEPWTIFVESAVLAAQARWGSSPAGAGLRTSLATKARAVVEAQRARIDYPVAGCVLVSLGIWELLHGRPEQAPRLLALGERFGYSRFAPSMDWAWVSEACEERLPGALPAALASYGERRGADVVDDARAALGEL